MDPRIGRQMRQRADLHLITDVRRARNETFTVGLGTVPEPAVPPGTDWFDVPFVNRVLGSTICPSMKCENYTITNADGTTSEVWGQCETFWRIDRPRAYVVTGLGLATVYGLYKFFSKRGRRR